jgi:hypothetical protein
MKLYKNGIKLIKENGFLRDTSGVVSMYHPQRDNDYRRSTYCNTYITKLMRAKKDVVIKVAI